MSNGDEKDSLRAGAWKMGFGDPERSRREDNKVILYVELRHMEDV